MDQLLQTLSDTNCKMIMIHQNEEKHLCGGLEPQENRKWVRVFEKMIAGPLKFYILPTGNIAYQILELLMLELKEACLWKWNLEWPQFFWRQFLTKSKALSRQCSRYGTSLPTR